MENNYQDAQSFKEIVLNFFDKVFEPNIMKIIY